MKYSVLKWGLLLFFCFGNILALEAEDTVKISISINYAIDLSDTYGGGNLFSGESTFALSWFGLKGSFGHLNSQYYSLVEVPYSDLGQTLELYIPEISFMSLGSLSLFVRPVSKKWITMDVVFGASMGRAKSFFIKDIEYEYSLQEQRLTYVFTDYHYVRKNHFGYHSGIDMTFYIYKNFGIQLNARMHDMKSGSLFFVGTGLSFKL